MATGESHDLPAAWRMALRVCPYCGGSGKRDDRPEEPVCGMCNGSGDLFGCMLEQVYAMGRDEGVLAMRALHAELVRTGKSIAAEQRTAAQLKARLGL